MRGSELCNQVGNKESVSPQNKIKARTSFDTRSDTMLDNSSNETDEITGWSRGKTMSLSISILDTAAGGKGETLRRIPAHRRSYRKHRLDGSMPRYIPDASTGKVTDRSSNVSISFPFKSPDPRRTMSSRQDVYALFDRISFMAG
jgi:hypothetical protein